MIYFLYFFTQIFLCYHGRKSNPIGDISRILSPVLFTLLIGLRHYSIGVDSEAYADVFYRYGQHGASFFETGYNIVMKFVFNHGGDYCGVFLICAFISAIFIYLTLQDRRIIYFPTACFLYILPLVTCFNIMRQSVVCFIFLYAFLAIIDRKVVKYILLIGLGFMFHVSAVILLPLYFIAHFHFNKKVYLYLYILSFSFIFLNFSIDVSSILDIDFGSGTNYGERYQVLEVKNLSVFGFLVISIFNVVVFLIMYFANTFEKMPVLSNFVYICFFIKNLSYQFVIVSRISEYFFCFVYILFPLLVCIPLSNKYKIVPSVYYSFFVFIQGSMLLNAIFSPRNELFPYLFFWE